MTRIGRKAGRSVEVVKDALLVCIKGCLFMLTTPDAAPRSVPLDAGNTLWIGVEKRPVRLVNNIAEPTEVLLIEASHWPLNALRRSQ